MSDSDKKPGAVQSIRSMASNSVARLYGGKKSPGPKSQGDRTDPPASARPPAAEGAAHAERILDRADSTHEPPGTAAEDAMEVVQEAPDNVPQVPARPPAKAIWTAVAVLAVATTLLVRTCSSDPPPKVESAVKSSDSQWKQLEPNEVRPLAPIDPKTVPGLVTGVEREHQMNKRVSSIARPLDVPAPIKVEAPPADPEQVKIKALEERVETLKKELEASRKAAEPSRARPTTAASRKKVVVKLPSVKVMAIARTDGCLSCPVLALLDVDGVARQVGSGDQISGYTVSVSSDRVALTRNKEQHVFYSLTPPN